MQNRELSRYLHKMHLCSPGCVWMVFGMCGEGLRLCKRQQWRCTSMNRRGEIFGLSSEMCTVTGLLQAFLPMRIISKSPFHILRKSEVYLDFFIFLGELSLLALSCCPCWNSSPYKSLSCAMILSSMLYVPDVWAPVLSVYYVPMEMTHITDFGCRENKEDESTWVMPQKIQASSHGL